MTIVYKTYDQAQLDAQLNNRKRVPNFQEHVDRWQAGSAQVLSERKVHGDLAYGAAAGERLDYFPVPDNPQAPLMVFIHGGYWYSRDKRDFLYLAPAFLDAGIAFASLNYTLAPEASIPVMVDQVRAAVAWLAERGEELGFDAGRLHLSGHSAGGHLVAMAAMGGGGGVGRLVRGGCSVSGLYELEPIRLSELQAEIGLDEAAVATASPTRLAPEGAPPLICAVGGIESEEFLAQQADFVAAWSAAGTTLSEVPLPGRDHFTALDALGDPDHALFQAVRAQVLG